MKKLISVMLALSLIICMVPAVSAAGDEATEAAKALYELGLFRGTGTNPDGTPIFDLDKTPTRNQAVIMLVRLLGKEDEALAGNWELPFTDVAKGSTAYPYIGYAYANGLTNGTSATTYSGTNPIKPNQYIAFVLRSLGYESGKDFEVSSSWKLSDELGITNGEYANAQNFTRGDVAIISYNSLSCAENGTGPFASIPEETPEQAQRLRQFKSKFRFPITSKGLTLTWEQALALVGQDLPTVKEHVKSLEDVLYYMVASGYTQGTNGDLDYLCREYPYHMYRWHFNFSPTVVLKQNSGNCGGTSGLVACLLEGDYDEVGMVEMLSAGTVGGHIANYLKDGNTYLVFDVNKFAGGTTTGYNRSLDLQKNKNLDKAVLDAFGKKDGERTRVLIATYTGCYDGDAPIAAPPAPEAYLIEGSVENFHVVRETPEEGHVYKFVSVPQSVLDTIEGMRNTI